MPEVTNPRLLFNEYPTGYPIPGKTTIYDDSQKIDLDAPLNGGVLLKVLVLSVDPYQRGRMRPPIPGELERYIVPFQIGEPLSNFGVGIVLRSEDPKVKAGDHVYGALEYQAYIVLPSASGLRVLENTEKLPWSVYVGVAGMPGQTAFIGWKEFSKAKKGETVFVTTAGGPVGSAVVQIAKSEGLKVIASAGSDEKVAFAKELGADVAFNYKTQDTRKVLEGLGHGIDIYWDNVGGEVLEVALDALNNHGRVINCGAISGYNSETGVGYGIKNLWHIIGKRLTLNGFIIMDLLADEAKATLFYSEFPPKIAKGEIKQREHVYRGLEQAGQAILDVQKGDNTAKAVVLLADH
ncbi:NAD-P-binding protein [Hysterangium stoloniferum]|nr:NAD-P-binding protein [Hysterangium stoloniferum]